MNTVLITGVTGFLGRYIARQFAESGWSVVGIGTRPPENSPKQNLYQYHQIKLPSLELVNLIKEVNPKVCIHCAGRASVNLSITDPASDFSASVAVTFNLLEALRIYAPECCVIYLSSAAIYGNPERLPVGENQVPNPISPYGFHKLIGEQLCKEFFKIYQLPTAIVRIFSAYGPGLRRQVLWDMCHKALTQPQIKLRGTGSESRDYIHAIDVASAIYMLSHKSSFEAEVYNLARGIQTTIKELANMVVENLGLDKPIEFDGINPQGNPLNWQADISRLTEVGFTPEVSLERGLKVYAQWCRAEVLGW